MVVKIPFGKIMILLVLLSVSLLTFFFWLRRTRIEKRKRQLKNLRDHFADISKIRTEEPTSKDTEVLERIVREIEKAADGEGGTVKLSLKKGYDLKIEAPDVIALQTPRYSLHKSFSKIKFRKLEKTDEGIKLHLMPGQEIL